MLGSKNIEKPKENDEFRVSWEANVLKNLRKMKSLGYVGKRWPELGPRP